MDEFLLPKTFVHDVDDIGIPHQFNPQLDRGEHHNVKEKNEQTEKTEKDPDSIEVHLEDGSLNEDIVADSIKNSELPSPKLPSHKTKRRRLEKMEENSNSLNAVPKQKVDKSNEENTNEFEKDEIVMFNDQYLYKRQEDKSMATVKLSNYLSQHQKELIQLQHNQVQQHQVQQHQHVQLQNRQQHRQVHQHQQFIQQQQTIYQRAKSSTRNQGEPLSESRTSQTSPTLHQLLKYFPGGNDESNRFTKSFLDQTAYKILFQNQQNNEETHGYKSQHEQSHTNLSYYKNLDRFSNDKNRQFRNLKPPQTNNNNKFVTSFFEENKDNLDKYVSFGELRQTQNSLESLEDFDRTIKPYIKASSVQELLMPRNSMISNGIPAEHPAANTQTFPTIRLKTTRELMEPTVTNNMRRSPEYSSMPGRFPTVFRNSRPLDANNGWGKAGGSCIMWVHLQASICTEWEQSSMVMKSQKPLVLQTQNVPVQESLENKSTKNRQIISHPDQPILTNNEPDSQFVQELEMLRRQQKPPGYKKPRTIHRCILKTTATGGSEAENCLICHVCSSGYPNYRLYLAHLMDSTCIKAQQTSKNARLEEKDGVTNHPKQLPSKQHTSNLNPISPVRYNSPNITTVTNSVPGFMSPNRVNLSSPRPSIIPMPMPQTNPHARPDNLLSPNPFETTFTHSNDTEPSTQVSHLITNNSERFPQTSAVNAPTSPSNPVYKMPSITNQTSVPMSSKEPLISEQQIYNSHLPTLIIDRHNGNHVDLTPNMNELKTIHDGSRGRGRGRGRPRTWRRTVKRTGQFSPKKTSTDTDSDHDIEILSQSKPRKDHFLGQKSPKMARMENPKSVSEESDNNTTGNMDQHEKSDQFSQEDAVILERTSTTKSDEDTVENDANKLKQINSEMSPNNFFESDEETIEKIAKEMTKINTENTGKDFNENNTIMTDDISNKKTENGNNYKKTEEDLPVYLKQNNSQDPIHSNQLLEIHQPENVQGEQINLSKDIQHQSPDIFPTNHTPDNNTIDSPSSTVFDEKAASETLLMLSRPSSEVAARQDLEVDSQPTTSSSFSPTNKSNLLFPRLCPCESSTRLPRITVQEYADDQAKFADLSSKVTSLLLILLGETKLVKFGYPTLSVADVLARVLKLTGTPVAREDDLCSSSCKVDFEADPQRTFRLLKARHAVMEINTESLLRVCVPEPAMWDRFGWRGKSIYRIVTDIAMYGIPSSDQHI